MKVRKLIQTHAKIKSKNKSQFYWKSMKFKKQETSILNRIYKIIMNPIVRDQVHMSCEEEEKTLFKTQTYEIFYCC